MRIMKRNILILFIFSIMINSCRWDTRKDYKYIGYSSIEKEITDTIIFKTVNDTLAYIKAFELLCNSQSDKFDLFDENGVEISKTIKFVTKSSIEDKFKQSAKEKKEASEASKQIKVETKQNKVEFKTIDEENEILIERILKQSQVIGKWKAEYNGKIILFKKSNEVFLVNIYPNKEFEFYEKDDEMLVLKYKNRTYYIVKWLAESVIKEYNLNIKYEDDKYTLLDHQFHYTIDSNGNLIYIYSPKDQDVFYKL